MEHYAPVQEPPLVSMDKPHQIYTRRWYILALFSAYSFTQAILWNTWGPISDSAQLVFGWSDGDITLFAMVGNTAYVLTVFILSGIIDKYGLRVGMLAGVTLLLAGCVVRCISSDGDVLFWTSLFNEVMTGTGATVACAAPPLLSSVWFPAHQRTTSTSIGSMAGYLGVSFSFILGPQLVHFIDPYSNTTSSPPTHEGINSNSTDDVISKQRTEIMDLLYIEMGWTAVIFLLILVYFPAKPPSPPSQSAAMERVHPVKGLWQLTKKVRFWMVGLAFAFPTGALGVWVAFLNINFNHLGVSQNEAAWLGFYFVISGALAGIIFSVFSDHFSRHMKVIVICLYSLASASLVWVLLLGQEYITFNKVSVYASVIISGVCVNGAIPLFYELTCEMFYPIPEGTIGGYLTCLNNIVGILCLTMFQSSYLSAHVSWANWAMLGCTALGIPLMACTREKYGKLKVDDEAEKQKHRISSEAAQNGNYMNHTLQNEVHDQRKDLSDCFQGDDVHENHVDVTDDTRHLQNSF